MGSCQSFPSSDPPARLRLSVASGMGVEDGTERSTVAVATSNPSEKGIEMSVARHHVDKGARVACPERRPGVLSVQTGWGMNQSRLLSQGGEVRSDQGPTGSKREHIEQPMAVLGHKIVLG
jgi:hypothetical protein